MPSRDDVAASQPDHRKPENEGGDFRSAATVQEWTIVAKFHATHEDAHRIKAALETTATALIDPGSEESASELFKLGAVAVASAAAARRAA